MSETIDAELIKTEAPEITKHCLKEEMSCWPGSSFGCEKSREWAVFHDKLEAELPFDYLCSVYIGTCSEHLSLALQRHPTALNYVRPY